MEPDIIDILEVINLDITVAWMTATVRLTRAETANYESMHYYSSGEVVAFNVFDPIHTLAFFALFLFAGIGVRKPSLFMLAFIILHLTGVTMSPDAGPYVIVSLLALIGGSIFFHALNSSNGGIA